MSGILDRNPHIWMIDAYTVPDLSLRSQALSLKTGKCRQQGFHDLPRVCETEESPAPYFLSCAL